MAVLNNRLQDENFGDPSLNVPFTMEESTTGIKNLKMGKATGFDGIANEILQQFGLRDIPYETFNLCFIKRLTIRLGQSYD